MVEKREIGLVMQGGGALGAYEYGAVQALLDNHYRPTVISGVSIGAINTVALAGARGGDMRASLDRMWTTLTMPNNPFLAPNQQAMLSLFGNPAFWSVRRDWTSLPSWTNYYDTKPMYRTLHDIVDFDRINAADAPVRMAVTATCVEDGSNRRFANFEPALQAEAMNGLLNAEARDALPPTATIKARTVIGPEHVMASGALPPSFPAVEIGADTFWDGGLFDNTPLRPLIEMLTPDEAEHMPIVVINLFPNRATVPRDMVAVQNRMMAIQYESRFSDAYGGLDGTLAYGRMLGTLLELASGSGESFDGLRRDPQFRRMLLYRALRNLTVIPAITEFSQIGPMDFSAYGIETRRDAGYRAVLDCLSAHGGRLGPRDHAHAGHAA